MITRKKNSFYILFDIFYHRNKHKMCYMEANRETRYRSSKERKGKHFNKVTSEVPTSSEMVSGLIQ